MSDIAGLLAMAARLLPDLTAFAPVVAQRRRDSRAPAASEETPRSRQDAEQAAFRPMKSAILQTATSPKPAPRQRREERSAPQASFARFAPMVLPTSMVSTGLPAVPMVRAAAVEPSAFPHVAAVAPGFSTSSFASAEFAPTARAMAPPAPAGSSGPTGGDVVLDGVRLGHWVAEQLADSAGRPQRGGAAFDPRLGARWPGTLQGS